MEFLTTSVAIEPCFDERLLVLFASRAPLARP